MAESTPPPAAPLSHNLIPSTTSDSDRTGETLLGLPTEIRRLILLELLGVKENRIEIDTDPRRNNINGEDLMHSRRGTFIRCPLSSNIIYTCRQLYQEGMQILLGINIFVAILGRHQRVIDRLKDLNTIAYWVPQGMMWNDAWNAEHGYFDLRGVHGQIECRPFLAIAFENDRCGHCVLVPLYDLREAIYAAYANETIPDMLPEEDPVRLYFQLNRGMDPTISRLREELTEGRLGNELFFWLGDKVLTVRTQELHFGDETAMDGASLFSRSIRQKKNGRSWPHQNDPAYDTKLFRHLRRMIGRMDDHLDSGQDTEALLDFTIIAARMQLYMGGHE